MCRGGRSKRQLSDGFDMIAVSTNAVNLTTIAGCRIPGHCAVSPSVKPGDSSNAYTRFKECWMRVNTLTVQNSWRMAELPCAD